MKSLTKFCIMLVVALIALPAFAQLSPGASTARVIKYRWPTKAADGAGGIDGAAVTSPVIQTAGIESLVIVATAATTARDITVTCLAKDGTTALFTLPVVNITTKGVLIIRPDMTVPGTAPTGVTYYNTTLCPRMQVSLPSVTGGAGVGATLAVYGRGSALTRPARVQYESGSVTAGAALTSGVIDTSTLEHLQVIVEATTTNRALVVTCLAADGTTSIFDFASLTVTAGSKYMRTFRLDAPIPGSEPTGVVHLPFELCAKMQATVAAAGAASAKLAVYGR